MFLLVSGIKVQYPYYCKMPYALQNQEHLYKRITKLKCHRTTNARNIVFIQEVVLVQAQEDIKGAGKDGLWDIDGIDIDKFDTIENKTVKFAEDTGGNVESHINSGYVVRNYFSDGGYSATEAFIHYIKKTAEINY